MFLFLCVLQEPFSWVLVDVVPDLIVVLLIADHMVIVGALEDPFSLGAFREVCLFGKLIFIPADDGSQRRGWVSRPGMFDPQQQVDVIGHDNIVINNDGWILDGDLADEFFCDQPVTFWDGKPVPYDLAEDLLSALGADGYEIGTVLVVVVISDPVVFSCGMFHGNTSRYVFMDRKKYAKRTLCKMQESVYLALFFNASATDLTTAMSSSDNPVTSITLSFVTSRR